MSASAVLGVDIGTSSTRGLLVDAGGTVLATADAGYQMRHPGPGWAVQSPGDWWRAFTEVTREMAGRAGDLGSTVAAVGLSGQQAGLVRLDATGAVVGDGILWCDNRSDAEARQIQEGAEAGGETLRFGGPVTGAQWAAKLRWLADRSEPAPARVMGVKDYVRLQLCPDAHVTDPVEASVSGLFDVATGQWIPERLAAVGLDASALPEVAAADAPAGRLSPTVADELGLPAGTPVTVGIGDCGAAGLGAGAVFGGAEYLGFGSSGITFRAQDGFEPDAALRVRSCRYVTSAPWFTMGVVQTLGLAWSWWGEVVAGSGDSIDHGAVETLCRTSPPGARGLVFLPYLMGDQTPHMDGRLRASFVGLDISHRGADLARAVLEGMAFAMWDAFQALPGTPGDGPLSVTGKAADNQLWLEILAATCGRTLEPLAVNEGSAYGAAMLARALADGDPVDAVSRRWVRTVGQPVEPDPELAEQMATAHVRYLDAFPAAGVLPPASA